MKKKLKFRPMAMSGRLVLCREITEEDADKVGVYIMPDGEIVERPLDVCADCGQPAKYIIVELNGSVWAYCGICEVG